jgi:hypothetical protein
MSQPESALSPKFKAANDLLRRTGLTAIRVGWTDKEEDGEPIIWHVTGTWGRARYGINKPAHGKRIMYEVAAALDPETAILRLCEAVIDGGECAHCHRPTIFIEDEDTRMLDQIGGCIYAWDPELQVFRRGCEGD